MFYHLQFEFLRFVRKLIGKIRETACCRSNLLHRCGLLLGRRRYTLRTVGVRRADLLNLLDPRTYRLRLTLHLADAGGNVLYTVAELLNRCSN